MQSYAAVRQNPGDIWRTILNAYSKSRLPKTAGFSGKCRWLRSCSTKCLAQVSTAALGSHLALHGITHVTAAST